MASADVELRLRLNDQASRGLKRAEQDAQKGAAKTASATEREAARAAAAAARGANMQRGAFQRLSQAREQLGIRPERAIQREIQRTTAAYARLKSSGTLSWREQARAAEQVRSRVAALANEMGRLTARQRAAGASVAAGAGAAGYVLKEPVQRAIGYDYRLAQMANTAFAERDLAGRKIGMKELENAVDNAVRQGGGTREGAAEALDRLIASGAVGSGEAMRMLPQLVKAATASGADVGELSTIGIRAMQSFGIAAEELPNVLNMAVSAGQAGGFELKDMARWLPQQLAAARMSGLSGRADFAAIAALNQAAAITAGNEDEAGNNVANILRKINSQDTALDVRKVMGIDLSKYLQESRAKNANSIDAFAGLITRSVEKDPKYRALQAKLGASKNDDERRATLESMSAIAMGSSVGRIVQDQQAMMALIAMLNNQGYMQDVRRQVLSNDVASGGAVDENFALMSGTSGFRVSQAVESANMAQKKELDKLTPSIGAAADMLNKLATEHSGLFGATTLAATALTAFAGVAGTAALALGGRAVAGRALGGIAGRLGAAAGLGTVASRASAGVATAGVASKFGKGALKMAGKGGIVAVGSMAGEYALGKAFGEDSAVTRYGSAALSGAGIGATVGSIIPGVGTAIGAAAGGAIGLIAQGLSDWLGSDDAPEIAPPQQEQRPIEFDASLKIGLTPGLVVQSQNMAASGGNVKMDVGNIFAGASL